MTIPIRSSSKFEIPAEGVRWPNLFIVGAPKCGTTALCRQLGQHPDIFFSERKEMHFLDDDLTGNPLNVKSEAEYANYYHGRTEAYLGDGSTWYLYSDAAARQIKARQPDARIIICLRDPVALVNSLFHYRRFIGLEKLDNLETCLQREDDHIEAVRSRGGKLEKPLLYKKAGLFSANVQRYLELFSKDRVFILIQENYRRDSGGTHKKIFKFLGIDDRFVPANEAVNVTLMKRNYRFGELIARPSPTFRRAAMMFPGPVRRGVYGVLAWLNVSNQKPPPLDAGLKADLTDYFAADVDKLSGLLGRDLSHWLAA